jgi:non-heme chloroperoxidase
MRKVLIVIAVVVLVPVIVLAGMIAFGAGAAPTPMRSLSDPFASVDFSRLPAIEAVAARDGVKLAYRFYPPSSGAAPERVVILVHGATASSTSMHPLAAGLAAQRMAVYTLDMRGHGDSGRRGDLDYPGQLDDDLADIVSFVKARYPGRPLNLVGFSAGGGFSLHTAATPLGSAFDRVVLLSPMLGPRAPTTKPTGSDALVTPFVPRIIAIVILNRFGIYAFNHLQTLAFGDFNRPELTPNYSFLLMSGFATADYAADVRNAKAPLAVVIGANDEFFAGDKFAPALDAIRPGIPVRIMPRLTHIGLITDPGAVPATVAAIRDVKQ